MTKQDSIMIKTLLQDSSRINTVSKHHLSYSQVFRKPQGSALRLLIDLGELPNFGFVIGFFRNSRFHIPQVPGIPILARSICLSDCCEINEFIIQMPFNIEEDNDILTIESATE